ncbi:MAG: hypothetical protein CMH22_05870 [Methylophaga sp.]|nr:hypothetical protein [Methylophaga sp.]|tara:strand:+ start:76016 stop:76411 length:396 start_codon:yes stop_codon:yes gene_type:complete
MGVDFYSCNSCGESKYSEYVDSCFRCGTSLCTDCLVNDDVNSKFAYDYGTKFDESKIDQLCEELYMQKEDFYDSEGNPYWKDGEIIDDTNIQPKYCPYCSGKEVNKEGLFEYLVEKYKIDINKEWVEYNNQ